MKKEAQASVEYMAIFGITTVLVLFILATSFYYSRQTQDEINTNQLDGIAKGIVDKAESVYYFGEPSKSTMRVFLPKGIQSVAVKPSEIDFRVYTQSGPTDIFYSSRVPLQGNLSSVYGYHDIVIEARQGFVWINST